MALSDDDASDGLSALKPEVLNMMTSMAAVSKSGRDDSSRRKAKAPARTPVMGRPARAPSELRKEKRKVPYNEREDALIRLAAGRADDEVLHFIRKASLRIAREVLGLQPGEFVEDASTAPPSEKSETKDE
jgi:hypothetical protein